MREDAKMRQREPEKAYKKMSCLLFLALIFPYPDYRRIFRKT